MSEFKFTKGKWYLQEFTDVYTNIIRVKTDTHDTIYLGSTPQDPKSESRYNALLISKAPEMLEMLIQCKNALDKIGHGILESKIEQLIKEATEIKE